MKLERKIPFIFNTAFINSFLHLASEVGLMYLCQIQLRNLQSFCFNPMFLNQYAASTPKQGIQLVVKQAAEPVTLRVIIKQVHEIKRKNKIIWMSYMYQLKKDWNMYSYHQSQKAQRNALILWKGDRLIRVKMLSMKLSTLLPIKSERQKAKYDIGNVAIFENCKYRSLRERCSIEGIRFYWTLTDSGDTWKKLFHPIIIRLYFLPI